MGDWEHGLCSCFDDCGTCVLVYFVPCYIAGKDAEAVGDSCFLCGIAWLFLPPCITALTRGKVRDRRSIDGSFIGDCCVAFFCQCCVMIQLHQEVLSMTGGGMAVERE